MSFKRPLHTASFPRPSALGVSTDPWAGYQLCPDASEADKAAYAALRTEITDKAALSSVKELGSQSWWAQQTALTYNADRDSRMLFLLRAALPHHKKSLDTAMINFQLDKLLSPLCDHYPSGRQRRQPLYQPRPHLSAEERAKCDALLRIRTDHSLVSAKMLEEAYAAYAARQISETAAKKARNDALTQAERVHEASTSAVVSLLQVNGWA